ncbi:MAG: hypothetical protein E7448_04425 [Ruminococcaceae bacterium]|nr:hypothetical protein [Oscillospiraceae bacterium]
MNTETNCGKIKTNRGWLMCPICGKKLLRLTSTTTAKDLPVFCKHCHQESIVNILPEPEP